jgi:hypothetical protein
MKVDAATIAIEGELEALHAARVAFDRVTVQRDEARLRVNLLALALGHALVYPIPERHAAVMAALGEALLAPTPPSEAPP